MAEEVKSSKESPKPILHVLVVGFHHKKGCQVEYSFPPLVEGDDPTACPNGWKYLPTLALPDGSHNYDEDAVYFHLPSLSDPKRTIYGISCYRQIPVEKLKIRTADLTRSTVQKSVCVLSALPLYGHIQVKMALITHAYFDEGDFSQVKLLHDTYHHLNSCMEQIGPLGSAPQLFVGLSARDLILQFGHKAVLLFKLLLLERRLVFYRSPVQPLCAAILTLLSLHPGMIEQGLLEAACVRPSRPMSPIPDFSDADEAASDNTNNAAKEEEEEERPAVRATANIRPTELAYTTLECDEAREVGGEGGDSVEDRGENVQGGGEVPEAWMEVSARMPVSESLGNFPGGGGSDSNLSSIAQMSWELCGLPLPLFTQGNLCLPYLSLPYLDLLGDVNVRGYIVGATNVLFKQKKNLADVLVEVEGARVETQDPELRRQLHLTTEDLRFAEYVVRRVTCERHDVFLDGVGWEGGDEWIRAQFKAYALCLLRTSLLQDGSREMDHFNASFMTAWKATHNYRRWLSGEHNGIWDLNPGHPFAGQLSVADMKLRLSHTMQNTEGGRKLNQAMTTTGRAVGGAISQARGALTSWWSTLTTADSNADDGDNTDRQEKKGAREINPARTNNPQFVDGDESNTISPIVAPVEITIVDNNDRVENKTRPEYQPVHTETIKNEKLPSPTSCQLNNHVASRTTELTSVENIECDPPSLKPCVVADETDSNREAESEALVAARIVDDADRPNRNSAYMKSEVVDLEKVERNEVVIPKVEVLESLSNLEPTLDSANDVLRIS